VFIQFAQSALILI